VVLGNQAGQKRRGGRTAEGAADSDGEEHRVDGPDAVVGMKGKANECEGATGLSSVADEDDGAAVVLIGDMARQRRDDDRGQEGEETRNYWRAMTFGKKLT